MERRPPRDATDALGRAMYQLICSHDGITAREMARQLGVERKACNQRLYAYPFIRDLCYHDDDYRWHGLIQQRVPHEGLFEFSGWYGTVAEFMAQDEDVWLDELCAGCKRIGRSLNDTRGLIHSFRDCRAVMRETITALVDFGVTCDLMGVSMSYAVLSAALGYANAFTGSYVPSMLVLIVMLVGSVALMLLCYRRSVMGAGRAKR